MSGWRCGVNVAGNRRRHNRRNKTEKSEISKWKMAESVNNESESENEAKWRNRLKRIGAIMKENETSIETKMKHQIGLAKAKRKRQENMVALAGVGRKAAKKAESGINEENAIKR